MMINDDQWWSMMINDDQWWSMMINDDQWWSMQLIHVDNYTYIITSTYFGRKGIIILFVRGSSFKIATPTGPASYEQCLCSPRSSVTKKHWPLAWHWNSVCLVYTNKQKEIQNLHHSTRRRKANHLNRTKYLSSDAQKNIYSNLKTWVTHLRNHHVQFHVSWHVWHISRMPQCTLISTATSFNMSHARLTAYSSLASICKTKMVHEMLLMLPNHFVITNILRNPSWKPPCSISWHVWHISRMPQCTLISTATSFNMSHARLTAYSSLASICKTKMVHEMLLMLPNHFVITNILRNPSWKPPCSISWHVWHISRMPQCTLISTATSFNMSHARLMAYSSLASICKTKMVHEMLLMLPNHFVITNILRNHLETTMFNFAQPLGNHHVQFYDMSNSYL